MNKSKMKALIVLNIHCEEVKLLSDDMLSNPQASTLDQLEEYVSKLIQFAEEYKQA